MARFFFAVAPPEPVLRQIDQFRGEWRHPHHRVEPHVTVKAPFLWQGAEAAFLDPVDRACAAIPPFPMQIGATGRFQRSHVLFLTVAAPALQGLNEAVTRALEPVIPSENQRQEGGHYHPHLTLAAGRFGIEEAGLDAMEREAGERLANLPAFTVHSLRCYRWDEQGGRWQRHKDLPLGAGREMV